MKNKEKAIKWWNNLPLDSSDPNPSKRLYYQKWYVEKGVFTLTQSYKQLTSREVELIYVNEI